MIKAKIYYTIDCDECGAGSDYCSCRADTQDEARTHWEDSCPEGRIWTDHKTGKTLHLCMDCKWPHICDGCSDNDVEDDVTIEECECGCGDHFCVDCGVEEDGSFYGSGHQ